MILLFTEGKELATLEFDSPVDTLAPADFVNDVGQKQDAAIMASAADARVAENICHLTLKLTASQAGLEIDHI